MTRVLIFYLFMYLFDAVFVYKATANIAVRTINAHLPEDSVKLPLIPGNC